MKHLKTLAYIALPFAVFVACSSNDEAPAAPPTPTGDTGGSVDSATDTTVAVDASEDAGKDAKEGDAKPPLEAGPGPLIGSKEDVERMAKDDGRLGNVIPHIKGVMHSFVDEDPTLDLAATAEQNAANIQAQIQAQVASGCVGASITRASGSTTVTAVFGKGETGVCTLESGATVSGQVTATVTVTTTAADAGTKDIGTAEVGAPTSITVAFTFTDFKITSGSDSYVVNGTSSIYTADLKNYTLTLSAVSVSGIGSVDFSGTAAVTRANEAGVVDSGILEAALSETGTVDVGVYGLSTTLNGGGGFTPAGDASTDAEGVDAGAGWSCTEKMPVAYTITGLHKYSSQCSADNGTIAVVRKYTCTIKTKTGSTLTVGATTTYSMKFDSASATTGQIKLSSTTSVGDASTAAIESSVTVPGCGS